MLKNHGIVTAASDHRRGGDPHHHVRERRADSMIAEAAGNIAPEFPRERHRKAQARYQPAGPVRGEFRLSRASRQAAGEIMVLSLLRVRSLSRSLTWLLAASVVAAGMLAVEPADAARKSAESGQSGEGSEGHGRIPHLRAVREGCGAVLAVGGRHAARADCQEKSRRADHARRLRVDPAAALDGLPVRRPLPPATPAFRGSRWCRTR